MCVYVMAFINKFFRSPFMCYTQLRVQLNLHIYWIHLNLHKFCSRSKFNRICIVDDVTCKKTTATNIESTCLIFFIQNVLFFIYFFVCCWSCTSMQQFWNSVGTFDCRHNLSTQQKLSSTYHMMACAFYSLTHSLTLSICQRSLIFENLLHWKVETRIVSEWKEMRQKINLDDACSLFLALSTYLSATHTDDEGMINSERTRDIEYI